MKLTLQNSESVIHHIMNIAQVDIELKAYQIYRPWNREQMLPPKFVAASRKWPATIEGSLFVGPTLSHIRRLEYLFKERKIISQIHC